MFTGETVNYLTFKERPNPGKLTLIWDVYSVNGPYIGIIAYHPHWRKYVFSSPGPDVICDSDCLIEIANFMIKNKDARQ
jgi:hypothetical protein